MSLLTPNLVLPYLAAQQAQKHVTHNEAIRALDALVQIAIVDRGRNEPPASPGDGDRHLVGAQPVGLWAGKAGALAAFQDGGWMFHAPKAGWVIWIEDETALFVHDGTALQPVGQGGVAGLNPADLVGINTVADAVNRLAVAAPAALFTHDGDDHRLTINKAALADTASLVFQTGYSGRAEFGLAGDDDWRVKVSANGTSWADALVADRATGKVRFPSTPSMSAVTDPVQFCGYCDDANQTCTEGAVISIATDAANGGIDNRGGFAGAGLDYFTVPQTGVYFCSLVANLKQIPAIGRGGLYFSVSTDNGVSWTSRFKAMVDAADNAFGSNMAILALTAGTRVCVRANAPGGTCQFWNTSRMILFQIG